MRNKFLLIGIFLIAIFSFTILIHALTSDEQAVLQNELESLESNLTNSGYSWLMNYSDLIFQLNSSIKGDLSL